MLLDSNSHSRRGCPEIIELEWEWVDFARRRVIWPDSKTGFMSKPMSEESLMLFAHAPRLENCRFVIPAMWKLDNPMSQNTYAKGWQRILERAGVPHIGTHGIRHRATTEIANSGVPIKVGMQLTGHKTVTQFMQYVHTEDDPVRAAAETVAGRRRTMLSAPPAIAGLQMAKPPPEHNRSAPHVQIAAGSTSLGNYRPWRKRGGSNRAEPPKADRTKVERVST